jgi:two-component system, NarL family, sensor histidine kinase UhpB
MSIRTATLPRLTRRIGEVRRGIQRLSTFEKALAANSAIIVVDTIAGWWITQHNPETYHYLIDTLFITLATLAALAVNFALLRAAFAPLHSVLATIRAVEEGDAAARAAAREMDTDASALARAFNGMLDHLAHMRDETAVRVLRTQEAERWRLALELHDQTGQTLTALSLHAQAIAQGLLAEEGPAAARARCQAEHLAALAQSALSEVQAVARHLRPAVLDDLGLVAALHWLAEDARERLGVPVAVGISGDILDDAYCLPDDVATALFRIAQEAITNAVRHGHADRIGMRLGARTGGLVLTVADNGCGFAPTGLASAGSETLGLGIGGMRERARLLGGAVTIRSRPHAGTVIRAAIPVRDGPYAGGDPAGAADSLVSGALRMEVSDDA